MDYKQIRGMMDYEDLYSEMVRKFPSGSRFVEIGVWYGRSSFYMASEIVKSKKSIRLFSIDWFLKSPIEDVKNNLDRFDFVDVIKMRSDYAADLFKDGTIDFCFIDADHNYEGVKKDWDLYSPLLTKGSIVIFHDIGWAQGVKIVIKEDVLKEVEYKGSLPNLWWGIKIKKKEF